MTPQGTPAVATADRATAIVAAALDMFATHGYHGVGMDDIGAVVGVSGPAIYRHFPSKASLLAAVVDFQGARLLAEMQEVIAEAANPRVALGRLFRNLTTQAMTDSGRLIVTYFQEERDVPEEARTRLVDTHRRYVDELALVLRSVRDDLTFEEERIRIEGAVGVINSSRFFVTGIEPEALVDQIVAMAMAVVTGG